MSDKSKYVLLADDDEDDRLFFKDALEDINIKTVVSTVNDGIELMKLLLGLDVLLPDIIFLDLNMPRKNGMECLVEIRNNDRLKALIVAIYSTSSAERDIEEMFAKGANVYIKKPNDYKDLKKVIEQALHIDWKCHSSGINKDSFVLSK